MGEVVPHEEFLRVKQEHEEQRAPQSRENAPGAVTSPERFGEAKRVKEFEKSMIQELGLPPDATREMIAAATIERSNRTPNVRSKEKA
ncbi:MAG: hypothetical protein RL681_222 [Candidatus Parcubacteria bacterium]|jgi:hypothetical protein